MGKPYLHVVTGYIEKNILQNQQANFNQTWYISFLGKGNSKFFKLRARSSSKRR
jgi:hypothetical protein